MRGSASLVAEKGKKSSTSSLQRGTSFHSAIEEGKDLTKHSAVDQLRIQIADLIYSPIMEASVGIILLLNFAIIIYDTDVRAAGHKSPFWVLVTSDLCSVIYLLEFSMRTFVEGRDVLQTGWNRLDCLVVSLSVVEKFATAFTELDSTSLMIVKVFRIFRLLRLVRVMKLMSGLGELRKLVQMMMTCIKTLFWSFVLTFVLMTMWSVILVELVNPIVEKLESNYSTWGNDLDWVNAYTSVMQANLTLFQTIVAGDSWGVIPVPVIAEAPWTALLFIPAQVTLVFGVLNLVVAVIVDSFAEVRARDHKTLTMELEEEEKREKAALAKIFETIDADQGGSVSLEELQHGADCCSEFRERLRVMDVNRNDLQQLFQILDEDGSGDVDPDEFIDTFYRIRCGDSRTASILAKHSLSEMLKVQGNLDSNLQSMKKELRKVSDTVHALTSVPKRHSKGRAPSEPLSSGRMPSNPALEKRIRSAMSGDNLENRDSMGCGSQIAHQFNPQSVTPQSVDSAELQEMSARVWPPLAPLSRPRSTYNRHLHKPLGASVDEDKPGPEPET